jgi:hypothetical protein
MFYVVNKSNLFYKIATDLLIVHQMQIPPFEGWNIALLLRHSFGVGRKIMRPEEILNFVQGHKLPHPYL